MTEPPSPHLAEDLYPFASAPEALDPPLRARLESHVAGCPECQRAVADTQRLLAMLARDVPLEPSSGFRRAMGARLDAIDAERAASPLARLRAFFTLPRLALGGGLAVAALGAVLAWGPGLVSSPGGDAAALAEQASAELEVAEQLELLESFDVAEDLDVADDLDVLTVLAKEGAG